MKEIFYISELLIKTKLKVLTDAEKQDLRQFRKDYPFINDIEIEALVDKLANYSTTEREEAWRIIMSKAQIRKGKYIFEKPNNSWVKYAVAASTIALIAMAYYYKNKNSGTPNITPIQVEKKIDVPATSKATLTLDNGTNVTLEKGAAYQTENVKGDGDQIAYSSSEEKTTKINYNFLTIPRGGEFVLTLADGTKVWLNSESKIKFPVNFNKNAKRQVELVYGEAYFEVSPSTLHYGTEFSVLSPSQEIVVLGTEFNIKAYKDESVEYTTLVEGKVMVDNASDKQELLPNQQSVSNIISKKITVHEVDVLAETSWRNGVVRFRGKPLKDIMKVISRWYDVDIIFENKDLETVKFKGILSKDQEIEEILFIMRSNSINEYEINDRIVIIK